MRKNIKLNSDGCDSGTKKCKRGYYTACGRGLAGSAFGGSLEYGVRRSVLCWCFWQEYGFIRREDVSIFNLVYKETSAGHRVRVVWGLDRLDTGVAGSNII
jgi:hypothetical protein